MEGKYSIELFRDGGEGAGILRSLQRRLRYLASVDCGSSGQVVSQDDVLQRFRG